MRPYLHERLAVSVITFMELLSFPGLTAEEEKSIRKFLSLCEILQIDEKVREETIRIRRKYKVKLPDSIIGATAVTQELTLLTADTVFLKIADLKVGELKP